MAAKLKTAGDFEGTANAGKQEWGGKGDYSWIGFTNSENVGGDMKTSLAVSISTYLLGKISNYLAAWRIDTFLGGRYNVVSGPKAYKYEYYNEPPTKVLLKGETKADLTKKTEVRNELKRAVLGRTDLAERHEEIVKEKDNIANKQKQTVVEDQLTALNHKIDAVNSQITGQMIILKAGEGVSQVRLTAGSAKLQSGPSRIFLSNGYVLQQGTLIKLG